jgi:hypothetical protein
MKTSKSSKVSYSQLNNIYGYWNPVPGRGGPYGCDIKVQTMKKCQWGYQLYEPASRL